MCGNGRGELAARLTVLGGSANGSRVAMSASAVTGRAGLAGLAPKASAIDWALWKTSPEGSFAAAATLRANNSGWDSASGITAPAGGALTRARTGA
jgi:hypothetical protein